MQLMFTVSLEVLSAAGSVIVVGSDKGYIYPFEIMMDTKTKKKTFDPINEGGKVRKLWLIKTLERKRKD
jgi:hypothetical protein